MRFELLNSTFDEDGSASLRQHLACLVVDDRIAIDAGSLAMAATDEHRRRIRDVVLTHAHLDHIAGLPSYVDDLFATLRTPIRIHATAEVIDVLDRHIFNWSVYPRFPELFNEYCRVIEYREFVQGRSFEIDGYSFFPVGVDHKVPASGFIITNGESSVAVAGDTATLGSFRDPNAITGPLKAFLVECAFPDEMSNLASISHHMTPNVLARELSALSLDCPVLVMNIKPAYRKAVVAQLEALQIDGLEIMQPGRYYDW